MRVKRFWSISVESLRLWAIGVARREGEMDGVVRQHGMDFVRHGFDQGDQKGRSCCPAGFGDRLNDRELRCPVDCHIKIELAPGGADLGNVDVKIADRVGL
jgi:hypothetical protein